MEYVKGDLIQLAKQGMFDVIAHGCNCFCAQKSGIARQMVANFQTTYNANMNMKPEYTLEHPRTIGDINKLGQIQYQKRIVEGKNIFVVNCYTQYETATMLNPTVVEYDAVSLCFKKINRLFAGKHLGIPKIGCGLAGGDWNVVSRIIENQCDNMKVTVVEFDGGF